MDLLSKKFVVNSDAERMSAARYATEEFAGQIGLGRRDALRLDLLVEETLGMVKAMLEEFYGQIWFVGDSGACEIHFEVTADMNVDRRQELLSVSRTGKNVAPRGLMARLGEMISGALHGFGQTVDAYGREAIKYGIVHTPIEAVPNAEVMPIWTLQTYREDLDRARDNDGGAEEAWDELEKSIVARLADDVIVGIKGDRVDLIIKKDFK